MYMLDRCTHIREVESVRGQLLPFFATGRSSESLEGFIPVTPTISHCCIYLTAWIWSNKTTALVVNV
jgi:hypothetical protein